MTQPTTHESSQSSPFQPRNHGFGEGAELDSGNGIPRSDYELSPEQMTQLEAELWAEIQPTVEENNGIVIATVAWDSKYAAFGRTSEIEHYESENYDLHKGMIPYEDRSLFVYTIDSDTGAIGHVKRVVFALTPEETAETGLTGLEIVDDRITSEGEEHADLEEIKTYHGIESMGRCLNVASNHYMKRPGTSKDKQYTYASYKAVFDLTRQNGMNNVFAYLNTNAKRSFDNFGLESDLLAGKEFHVPNNEYDSSDPTSEPFELDYVAVCISDTPTNIGVFEALGEFVPETIAPVVHVG